MAPQTLLPPVPAEAPPEQSRAELADQIIYALSGAVEAKDRYTNGHSLRVANYAREIVRRAGQGSDRQLHAFYAGLLHDVGKIRVSDAIINKAGRLSDDEYSQMKLHTMAGYYILKEVTAIAPFAVGARWHHERYDGRGYPNGLSGENIPFIARVIAVADAYDAMTSSRSYRAPLSQKEVRAQIAGGIGTQFDPALARIMLEMIDEDTGYRLRQQSVTDPRKILAVDDDPMVLRLLEFTIGKDPNYRLVAAASGQEGLARLAEDSFDLVLLDVEMPGMDGFAVLARIRELYRSLPVTFMTGDKELELIQAAEAMGVSDYLTKPLVIHMLWESIQNVLSTSRYDRSAARLEAGGTERSRSDDR